MKSKSILIAIGLIITTLAAGGIAWAAAGDDSVSVTVKVFTMPGGSMTHRNVQDFQVYEESGVVAVRLEDELIIYSPQHWGRVTVAESK